MRPRRARFHPPLAFPGLVAALVGTLMVACQMPDPGGGVPTPEAGDRAGAPTPVASVLVRGRILPSELVLEPVFQVDAAPYLPEQKNGRHYLRGFGEGDELLFDLRFDGVEVADVLGQPEEHFTFIIPVGPEGPLGLERVELESADGRRVLRTAVLSPVELQQALEREDVVTVQRASDGRVHLRWDPHLFPAIMVRDPETGEILSFARGGEAVVVTEVTSLEVVVSDGVRSSSRVFQVRVVGKKFDWYTPAPDTY